jgi:predicted dehydrogenase
MKTAPRVRLTFGQVLVHIIAPADPAQQSTDPTRGVSGRSPPGLCGPSLRNTSTAAAPCTSPNSPAASWRSSCFSITVGEDRFSWLLVGDEGSLRIPDSGTVVVRQRHDDDEPVELQIASAEKVVLPIDLMQHTWNRLIEDFIEAVRNDDKDQQSHPSLPTLTDGLRTEEVIDAARRSSSTGRWATAGG